MAERYCSFVDEPSWRLQHRCYYTICIFYIFSHPRVIKNPWIPENRNIKVLFIQNIVICPQPYLTLNPHLLYKLELNWITNNGWEFKMGYFLNADDQNTIQPLWHLSAKDNNGNVLLYLIKFQYHFLWLKQKTIFPVRFVQSDLHSHDNF